MPDELLTPTEADVLPALLGEPWWLRSEINVEGVGKAAVTRALGTLEAKGLVRFQGLPLAYSLTETGKAAALRLDAEQAAALRARRHHKENPCEPE